MAPPERSSRYTQYVRQTLATRIPAILDSAAEGQEAEAVRRLRAIAGIVAADAPMELHGESWPLPGWEDLPARVDGRRPREAAFFDVEHWLYFRILQAVRHAETRVDPFRRVKHRDLAHHIDWAAQAIRTTRTFADALALALDANAHDLSQIAGPAARLDLGRDMLRIAPDGLRRLNIVADNFGGEFVADLVLATIAAEAGLEVVVHVKSLPMFVSDATAEDVELLFAQLPRDTEFGRRVQAARERGAMRVAAHPFWSAPKFFDALPLHVLEPGGGVLTVLKGDLNFRRAVGDAVVPPETPFEALPVLTVAPMLSLRSIKSYCVAAMDEWPAGAGPDGFPMDGSISLAQHIPARGA